MFSTSETTAKLDAALAKAQGEIEAAAKDKVNPAFRSKYADLTAVWAAIRPALSKHGIAVTQWPLHSEDNRLHMVTRLAHEGEWIKGEFSIPVDKQNSHGFGSAVTYAKRFALAAAVGVVADEDDDGNKAAKTNGGDSILHNPPPDRTLESDFAGVNGNPGISISKVSKEFYAQCSAEIKEHRTEPGLKKWGLTRKPEIQTKLPPAFVGYLEQEYLEQMHDIKSGKFAQ